jgi:hypothetical protein
MSEKAELEISIAPDGTVKIVTHGLRGESCVHETQALEKAIGSVTNREKTREYYQKDPIVEKARTKA